MNRSLGHMVYWDRHFAPVYLQIYQHHKLNESLP